MYFRLSPHTIEPQTIAAKAVDRRTTSGEGIPYCNALRTNKKRPANQQVSKPLTTNLELAPWNFAVLEPALCSAAYCGSVTAQ